MDKKEIKSILEKISQNSDCFKMKTSALFVIDDKIISKGCNHACRESCSEYWKSCYLAHTTTIEYKDWLEINSVQESHKIWSKKK